MSVPAPCVVRIVVHGWTYWRGQQDNRSEARSMLLDAFASDLWPPVAVAVTITPGGFIRTRLPCRYDGARGWDSKEPDLHKLVPQAEAAVNGVISGDVLEMAARRTKLLTLGIDLNVQRQKEERLEDNHNCKPRCPFPCTHAELVAVLDTASGKVVRWTGKSYPVDEQQHTLVHVKDLRTHFLDVLGERLLVLDLNLLIDRGRPSKHGLFAKADPSSTHAGTRPPVAPNDGTAPPALHLLAQGLGRRMGRDTCRTAHGPRPSIGHRFLRKPRAQVELEAMANPGRDPSGDVQRRWRCRCRRLRLWGLTAAASKSHAGNSPVKPSRYLGSRRQSGRIVPVASIHSPSCCSSTLHALMDSSKQARRQSLTGTVRSACP